MNKYLQGTRFAASSLIELVWADVKQLEDMSSQIKALTIEYKFHHQDFMANEFHSAANFYHAQMARSHEKFSGLGVELERKIQDLSESVDAKSVSISSLAGAILQLTKQCISLCYGRPQNAPKGADVGGVLVKDIIWEARNQSIHYESPKEISPNVIDLFESLDAVSDDEVVWDPCSRLNFAFEVVSFLRWRAYESYEAHMRSIITK